MPISSTCKECGNKSEFTLTIAPNLTWEDNEREDLELCGKCLINYCKDIIDKILIIMRI